MIETLTRPAVLRALRKLRQVQLTDLRDTQGSMELLEEETTSGCSTIFFLSLFLSCHDFVLVQSADLGY